MHDDDAVKPRHPGSHSCGRVGQVAAIGLLNEITDPDTVIETDDPEKLVRCTVETQQENSPQIIGAQHAGCSALELLVTRMFCEG